MTGQLVFIIYTLLLCKNYNKWVTIFIAIHPFIYNFALWNQSISVWITIIIILLYPFKFHNLFLGIKKFPFTLPLLAIGLSMLITNSLVEDVYKHTPSTITSIGSKCILVFIFWRIYQTSPKKTLSVFIKTSFIITSCICFYSLIETITFTNPYINWIIDKKLYIGETKFIDTIRFGMKRSQSVFPMHTTLAGFCINLSWFLYLAYKKTYIKNSILTFCIIILSFLCVFFTGARSGILGILFCFALIFLYERVNKKHIFLFLILSIAIFFITEDYLNEIIGSFTDTESTNGSNTDMRKEQLAISLLLFEQSPVFGNGFGFALTVGNQLYPELYGAESLWFNILINYGIIGLISYSLLFIYAIVFTVKQKNPILILYVLGFLAAQTLSSVPGIEPTYMLIYLFIANELLKRKRRRYINNIYPKRSSVTTL